MWNFVSDDMKLIQHPSDASKATMHGQANKGSILVKLSFLQGSSLNVLCIQRVKKKSKAL